ncbi:LACCASE-6 [Salix purpurea]|uniref:laccase n=1 Tax=Salix purpurea TaxID=77065 RepID=A0A9Q0SJL9_SALPP|nr:LACCASE-6 [Salix purpurea]
MANLVTSFMLWLCLISYAYITIHAAPVWPRGRSTRFYDFKIQTMTVNKLCNSKQIVTVNNMFPGPVVYAQEGDRLIVKYPYEEHIVILGEYWLQDIVQLERQVLASGGGPPPASAYTINGHPGPNYNCSANDVYKIDVVPGKTYLLRLINAGLNMENFFAIANHRLTIVEADAEYTKPFTTDRVMLGPGQTINVLVTADQTIGKYSMAMGPYMSAQNVPFQNISAIAYFQYVGAVPNSLSLPARLPSFNDNLAVKTVMDGLRGLNTSDVPKEIDTNLFLTIGLNVNKCLSKTPQQNCQGLNNGTMSASMNNISFIKPTVSVLEAYFKGIEGYFTDNFPGAPFRFYDFVNGAPNNAPNDTSSMNGTRVKICPAARAVGFLNKWHDEDGWM